MALRFMSMLGIFIMVAVAWLFSSLRWRVSWALVAKGLLLQFALALILLKTIWGQAVVSAANSGINSLLDAANDGTAMVFGPLADPAKAGGVIFFISVSGSIIFVASLTAALFHLGILQRVVAAFAFIMRFVLKTSGSESLAAAVNMFVGQDESALFIRPYLDGMTHSELMALMTIGMGTIASGILVTYSGILGGAGIPNAGGHLLAASVLSAPASLVIAKILLPETEPSQTAGKVKLVAGHRSVNLIDAICRGAFDGMMMALNVMAMLMAFVALLHVVNTVFGAIGPHIGLPGFTLEGVFGVIFRPFALVMGIAPADSTAVGSLLGKRMVINEFIAYEDLATMVKTGRITARSALIATYGLCGFANFSSIAIQIGGIGSLIPHRREDLARFGMRAMIGGTLATLLTGCIAGILL